MRPPLPNEIVPVELLGPHPPNIHFTGRRPLLFETRDDGRRVEYFTPEQAKALLSPPYNRDGLPPLFRVADDLDPRKLTIDQQVIEAIRKHAPLVAAIVKVHLPVDEPPAEVAPEPAADSDSDEMDKMDKPGLIELAKERGILVDARWNRDRILERIQAEAMSQ